eukprot:gene10481-8445_t
MSPENASAFVNQNPSTHNCESACSYSRFAAIKETTSDTQTHYAIAARPPSFDVSASLSLEDNVALIAVLEAIERGPGATAARRTLICVANTHIHANPELNDVKLWQVHTLLKGLEKIAASANIPMLVAGDFNSLPGSPAHTLLVKGKVEASAVQSIDPLGFLKEP